MELDDLKHTWEEANNISSSSNANIMHIIQQKDNGPVAALKKNYRQQAATMVVVLGSLIATNSRHADKMFTSVLFWTYVLFVFGVIVFARLKYNAVKEIEQMQDAVKPTLEKKVALLEKLSRQNVLAIRLGMAFMTLLLEILPYFQNFKMLNTWHSLSLPIRLGCYALFAAYVYFMTRFVSKRKQRELVKLKELVEEMK